MWSDSVGLRTRPPERGCYGSPPYIQYFPFSVGRGSDTKKLGLGLGLNCRSDCRTADRAGRADWRTTD